MARIPKQVRERRIFESLARLAGWSVTEGSISQPDPPEILCHVANRGLLGIELVALDAPKTRMRLDNMTTIEDGWERALATWSPEERARICAESADIYFSAGFDNAAGLRDRSRALRMVQKFLLENPGHSGPIRPADVASPLGLDTLTAHRGSVRNGPKFSHFSAGSWAPPQLSVIESKLSPGRYCACNHPLELFAYSVHDEPDLAVDSMGALKRTILAHLPSSAFRAVHIFDYGLGRHLWSSAAPSE